MRLRLDTIMYGETELEARQFDDLSSILGASLLSFVISYILSSVGSLISTTCYSLEPIFSTTFCLYTSFGKFLTVLEHQPILVF